MPETSYLKSSVNTAIHVSITLITAAVFVLDLLTILGIAVWVFYLVPVVLCIQQSRSATPYIVAAMGSGLIAAGFFLSPPGMAQNIAAINRAFGIVTLFGVAYLCQKVIMQRVLSETLLWLEQGQAEVSQSMLGELDVNEIGDKMLHILVKYISAQIGYLHRIQDNVLVPCGSFAGESMRQPLQHIAVGQGLNGAVAQHGEIVLLHDVPDGYMQVSSALGNSTPSHLIIAPVTADDKIVGVLEVGFIRKSQNFDNEIALFKLLADKVGIAIRSALYRENLKNLLEETQRQGEELQTQQEELRVTNEELQEQGRALQESQATLEIQQSELEQSNVQLEERARLLEQQKSDLLSIQHQMEASAADLEKANRYKSQFLANMSHELRTPLNSSLILSHMLAENKTGTLTEDQVRYARTIHASNTDLLTLINDILDLSKIEAGQVEVQAEKIEISSIVHSLHQMFEPIAQQKGVGFTVAINSDAPASLTTDEQRLQQILKNLLSNAFKFTKKGEVALAVSADVDNSVRFVVRDTGIGIPAHQQAIIFEAFRQADGSTSRMYGGTGLGLSISRELAHLLGGEISVQSSPEVGSTFTLQIPSFQNRGNSHIEPGKQFAQDLPKGISGHSSVLGTSAHEVANTTKFLPAVTIEEESWQAAITDDRGCRKHDQMILIVEDDEKFASVLCELVHELNFDCIHAFNGVAAVKLAQEYRPDAILLDVGLPVYSGLSVLERIKRDSTTRHIPVHMISVDDYKQTALELGAVGYALKPVAREEIIAAVKKLEDKLNRDVKHLLIVEDNATLRESLVQMLGTEGTQITSAGTAATALDCLAKSTFDCMVMDLMLPDASGYDILEQMAKSGRYAFPPVIVYTGRALSRDEELRLRRYSQSIIIKGAKSPERLLDEVSLFLHRVEASLPLEQQQILLKARQRDCIFEGRRILVAEDDVRNIFALTSVFEPLGAELEIARNGKEALEQLANTRNIDLVLMDLMMPEMDGLTAMQKIREQAQYKHLPIIALTAKAMPNDRQDCLNAGANDYIAKPINVDQLVSLCRVWLPK